MPTDPLQEVSISTTELYPIIERVEGALRGTRRDHALVAIISLSVVLMNPGISPEKLQQAVKDVSQFICMVIEDPDTAPEPSKILMN